MTVALIPSWDGLYWTGSAPPFVPAVLAAASVSQTGATITANLGVGNGRFYWGVYLSSDPAPTLQQLVDGSDAASYGYESVSAVGAITATASGLTADTEYVAYAYHEDQYGRPAKIGSTYLAASTAFTTEPSTGGVVTPSSVIFAAGFDSLATASLVTGTDYAVDTGTAMTAQSSGSGGLMSIVVPTTAPPPYSGAKVYKSHLPVPYGSFSNPYRAKIYAKEPTLRDKDFVEGTEQWVGFAMYVPGDYWLATSNSFSGMFFQFHTGNRNTEFAYANGFTPRTPPWALRLQSDKTIRLSEEWVTPYNGYVTNNYFATAMGFDDIKDKWTRWIIQVVWSKNEAGLIRVWCDDVLMFGEMVNRRTWEDRYPYFGMQSFGLYTGSSYSWTEMSDPRDDRIAYFDAVRMAYRAAGESTPVSADLRATVDPASYL